MPRDPFPDEPRNYEDRPKDVDCLGNARRMRVPSDTELTQPDREPVSSAEVLEPANPGLTERAVSIGDRIYLLRDSELHTLSELGTFRAVAVPDLARFAYDGRAARLERELQRLQRLSLLAEKTVVVRRDQTVRLVTLTRKGARLLRASGHAHVTQTIHHGFVNLRDAKHDADLYPLYQAASRRITTAGGRPTRVLLDCELKRNLNRDLALVPSKEMTDELRERIAKRHGLTVVGETIPMPDLRIEYQTADFEVKRLDLELATRNYRPRALIQKAQAGFGLYAWREDVSRLRRILDGQEMTAKILAL